jgi:hypothetical protein
MTAVALLSVSGSESVWSPVTVAPRRTYVSYPGAETEIVYVSTLTPTIVNVPLGPVFVLYEPVGDAALMEAPAMGCLLGSVTVPERIPV